MRAKSKTNIARLAASEGDATERLARSKREFAQRLGTIAADKSYRHIAQATGCNHESVRRWLNGRSGGIPAHFVVALTQAFNVSPTWLLLGIGSPDGNLCSNKTLGQCTVTELFLEMAERAQQHDKSRPQMLVEPKNIKRLRTMLMPGAKLKPVP